MMSGKGVQTEELDRLINSLNGDISDIKALLPTLSDVVDRLSEISLSNELENISNNVKNIYGGMNNITKILDKYIEILKEVNLSYRNQEEAISMSLNVVTKN